MSGKPLQSITGRTNEHIKNAVRLRENAAQRRERSCLFLEGARLVADAAASSIAIRELFITESAMAKYAELLHKAVNSAETVFVIAEHVADALSDTKSTQGVFGICIQRLVKPLDWCANAGYLALENVRDPGNTGTLLRTAEAFGLRGVIHSGCGDVYSPKVLRAGMGAQFRLPIWHTDNLPSLLREAAENGVSTFAAVQDTDAEDVSGAFSGSAMVAIGNEGSGLTAQTIAACQKRVTIPMAGRAESLNAAAAGAIFCRELVRQPGN
ncbi:MAG: RNA methyltransferase [Oscillospiraceae bacterium]|jgi:TrmH family RNA methyltransferase|nr:RNA methyltransferase [Oscillospiraceae bacterium]